MLGKMVRKSTSLITAIAVLCVSSMVALAAPNDVTGEITVTGQVTVNGQPAVSNSTIVSGSSIVTGSNSSAIISLGKNGRIEVLDDSTVTLKFTDNSIVGSLETGKVRVMNSAGVAATFTTKNSTIIADAGQANSFSVDVGCGDSAKCAQTFVETASGLITVRDGSTNKQVAAGTDVSVGNPSQQGCKPCLRPNPNPGVFPIGGIGSGALAALLAAIAGGVGAAIYFGTRDHSSINNVGGTVNVVSPIR
ncbi:MAG: hypothetical protein ACR2N3_03785 [Pyrinomonadaceae bacterium]